MRLLRRLILVLLAVACVGVVIGYQATRPPKAISSPRVFIPSAAVFRRLPPSVRVTIADVYWLFTVQYYGEHIDSDHRLDSLPAMADLVTELSPHFVEPYFFDAFGSMDVGDPQRSYDLLERGYRANPDDWHFPIYLAFFAYTFGPPKVKDLVASQWYERAARIPGAPSYAGRLAAELAQKGHDRQKAIDLWTQVYASGDKYARGRAAKALDKLLPQDKTAREKAVARLKDMVPASRYDQFIADVFQRYL